MITDKDGFVEPWDFYKAWDIAEIAKKTDSIDLELAYNQAFDGIQHDLAFWRNYLQQMMDRALAQKISARSNQENCRKLGVAEVKKRTKRERSDSCPFEAPRDSPPPKRRLQARTVVSPPKFYNTEAEEEELEVRNRVGPVTPYRATLTTIQETHDREARYNIEDEKEVTVKDRSGPLAPVKPSTDPAAVETSNSEESENDDEIEDDSDTEMGDNILEHPALTESSGGAWTLEEDTEVLRLRERVNPPLLGKKLFERFTQKFSHKERSIKSVFSRYDKYLSTKAVSSRPAYAWRRAQALAALDDGPRSKENEDGDGGEDKNAHRIGDIDSISTDLSQGAVPSPTWWTVAEDAELIHLREQITPRLSPYQMTKAFNAKFSRNPRTQQAMDSRYTSCLKSGAFRMFSAEEKREQALAFLKKLELEPNPVSTGNHSINGIGGLSGIEGPDTSSPHSKFWTVAEDAELIRLRERVSPTPSWPAIAALMDSQFCSSRSENAIVRRYYETLSSVKEVGTPGNIDRGKALEFLDRTSTPPGKESTKIQSGKRFSSSSVDPFSQEEDAELLRLREKRMPHAHWQDVTKLFNENMSKTRTSDSLRSRYRKFLSTLAEGHSGTAARLARSNALAVLTISDSNTPGPKARARSREDSVFTVSSEHGTQGDEAQ